VRPSPAHPIPVKEHQSHSRLPRHGTHTRQRLDGTPAGCGTTSLQFINSQIQPSQTPKVFETLNDVKQALQTKQIAALVTDTPTAQFISSSEIPGSIMVAQFPSTGEHYGLLFEKGNPLVTCVNKALATLKSNGTLAKLTTQYLKLSTSVPTIQP
jgi:polar amino acid transport system substrate-binding protein